METQLEKVSEGRDSIDASKDHNEADDKGEEQKELYNIESVEANVSISAPLENLIKDNMSINFSTDTE